MLDASADVFVIFATDLSLRMIRTCRELLVWLPKAAQATLVRLHSYCGEHACALLSAWNVRAGEAPVKRAPLLAPRSSIGSCRVLRGVTVMDKVAI